MCELYIKFALVIRYCALLAGIGTLTIVLSIIKIGDYENSGFLILLTGSGLLITALNTGCISLILKTSDVFKVARRRTFAYGILILVLGCIITLVAFAFEQYYLRIFLSGGLCMFVGLNALIVSIFHEQSVPFVDVDQNQNAEVVEVVATQA